jgi:hypothetical protein
MRKFLLILAIIPALVLVVGVDNKADALSGVDFNPARIIDDSVFFNPNTISPNQVQLFLNSKLSNGVCDTNGAQPYGGTTRAAYGTSRGYPPPYICLKDYSQNTSTRNAEPGLCNQYNGGVKSAAAIIYDVGQACGVNPKALLVLLEKEQSLLTDDWPWSVQYNSATGFGCPDTAPCDPQFGAFFDQVYYAARQFKRYERDATLFRYRANRDNFIQYHPNAACGGTNVFIQNQATAGLYNYTPYQPNAVALSNIYGGQTDGCSSYGNRNFWRLFNDWFGTVNGPAYSWQLVSQEAYSDPARTQAYSNIPTLQPGATAYFRIKAKNVGFLPWDRSFTNLGTSSQNDRSSQFTHASWLNFARPTKLTEPTVATSEIGTFDFSVTAPSAPGSYRESFNIVADGITWLNDIGLNYKINVVNTVSLTPSVTTLASGQQLLPKAYMLAPGVQSVLRLESNGNLVLYSGFQPIWSTLTSGFSPQYLIMQTDGNLVLYDTNNIPLWNSSTYGNPGSRLDFQADGNLVIYNQTNNAIWTTSTVHNPNYYNYVNTTLHTGKLFPGQQLQTADRRYRLVLQGDGNLVLYSSSRAVWASGTDGKQPAFLAMQSDGNLVLYDVNLAPIWHTQTNGLGTSALVLQPDANLVIYNGIGRPTWNSATVGQQ